jgi:hypothetical protein
MSPVKFDNGDKEDKVNKEGNYGTLIVTLP